MLTIMVASNIMFFKWQVELAYYHYKKHHDDNNFLVLMVTQNSPHDPIQECVLDPCVPFIFTHPWWHFNNTLDPYNSIYLPLNIQCSILQAAEILQKHSMIEILDPDMFHMKHKPNLEFDKFVLCDDIYETWHLKIKSSSFLEILPRSRLEIPNGGFVPILINSNTLLEILSSWLKIHIDLLSSSFSFSLTAQEQWWAGMYAFNLSCALHNIKMLGSQMVCVPHYSQEVVPTMYCLHYSACQGILAKAHWQNMITDSYIQNLKNKLTTEPEFALEKALSEWWNSGTYTRNSM